MAQKTISDLTAKASVVANDAVEIYDSENTNSKKALMSVLLTYIEDNITTDAVSVPVGAVIDFYQEPGDSYTVPSQFAECDGATLSDGDSEWNGYRIPNLNGDDVVLTLTWTADGGGSYATVTSTDVTALQQGDSVSGTGIASGTTITDITGTTVTISDTDATGEIESTFTNPGRFSRGGTTSGDGDSDRMQRIKGSLVNDGDENATVLIANDCVSSGALDYANKVSTGPTGTGSTTRGEYDLLFDSADSVSPNTAKTSDTETAPIYFTVIKIMRIK